MFYCYILHSKNLDRFYIGSTELLPKDRLKQHNRKHFGNSKFTAKTNDWDLVLSISCEKINQARKIELFIKRMKSKKYINSLISNQERVNWLLENI